MNEVSELLIFKKLKAKNTKPELSFGKVKNKYCYLARALYLYDKLF